MTYQKIIQQSIVYMLIASLVLNTGISGLISIMDNNQKPKKPMVEIAQEMKTGPGNQIQSQAVVPKPEGNRQKTTTVSWNGTNRANSQAVQPNRSANTSIPVNNTQYQILVRLIHAEAGGESLKGQVAVAAVLLNRIRSGRFPKSISGNVFQSGEFESVSNGYIWSEPASSAYKAANLALQGWDPTYGALYFYNPAKTYTTWIWSRPIHTRIGNHNFAG
jgi:spore germination cell wall hydrolase CwlJ-like protein